MRPLLHTVPLLLAVVLALYGCHGRAAVEDTVQREIEAITAMKQLSLVEYRVSKIVKMYHNKYSFRLNRKYMNFS